MKESNSYKKAGLQRKLDMQVVQALNLNAGEEILINLLYDMGKNTHRLLMRDVMFFFLVTTERIFIFNVKTYFKRDMSSSGASVGREVNFISIIPINEMNRVSVKMKHTPRKKERFFYIASTKKPLLSIEAENNQAEIFFKVVFQFQNKIRLIIDCLKTINSNIEAEIDFYVENEMEIFFDGIPADTLEGIRKRKKLSLYFVIVVVLFVITIWVVSGQLVDIHNGKQLYW